MSCRTPAAALAVRLRENAALLLAGRCSAQQTAEVMTWVARELDALQPPGPKPCDPAAIGAPPCNCDACRGFRYFRAQVRSQR